MSDLTEEQKREIEWLMEHPGRIYTLALHKWGREAQLGIIFEELGELISQISRYFIRKRGSIDDLASEVADAEICCAQLRMMMGECSELIDEQKDFKLRRLIERLHDRPDPPKRPL